MKTCIYDKTDKGREEIATRKNQLPARLRTLLVLIDGRHSLGSLLDNLSVLRLSAEDVDELLRQQYIALVSGGPAAGEAPSAGVSRAPVSARARLLARTREQAERKRQAAGAGALVPAD